MAFTIEQDPRWFMPYFKKDLRLDSNEWQTISLNLSDFQSYAVGRPTGNFMKNTDKEKVIRLGFITNEKKPGPFEFEIAYVEFK